MKAKKTGDRLITRKLGMMTKGRLESFTDAILAIIMTIMALEIKTPTAPTWHALKSIAIPLFAFVVSFFGLINLWIAHHHMLKHVTKISYRSVYINMALLFWVTLVPVAASWVADFPTKALPERFFIIVQLGWYVLLAWLMVSIHRDNPTVGERMTMTSWWTNALYVVCLIWPVPYSGLVIALIVMIRVPFMTLRGEAKGRIN